MEYPYFTTAPQPPYQFGLQLPPTPGNTGSEHSDQFSNSPHVRDFHNDQSLYAPALIPKQDVYDCQNYDTFNQQYALHGLPVTVKPLSPPIQHKSIITQVPQNYEMNIGGDHNDDANRRGSNSDDEDMTPAQTRRKAQNRVAQRAFRERKERHVKDLEAKLASMERATTTIAEENALLKAQLQKTSTENEILRATSGSHRGSSKPLLSSTGPMHYRPTDFYTDVLHAHENKTPNHRIVLSEKGERLLGAGATWDYIIMHPLYIRGMVDLGTVSERLKTVAKCDGQGPVFEESAIIHAIENSTASGNDELL